MAIESRKRPKPSPFIPSKQGDSEQSAALHSPSTRHPRPSCLVWNFLRLTVAASPGPKARPWSQPKTDRPRNCCVAVLRSRYPHDYLHKDTWFRAARPPPHSHSKSFLLGVSFGALNLFCVRVYQSLSHALCIFNRGGPRSLDLGRGIATQHSETAIFISAASNDVLEKEE